LQHILHRDIGTAWEFGTSIISQLLKKEKVSKLVFQQEEPLNILFCAISYLMKNRKIHQTMDVFVK
jgi:hypothetical protein